VWGEVPFITTPTLSTFGRPSNKNSSLTRPYCQKLWAIRFVFATALIGVITLRSTPSISTTFEGFFIANATGLIFGKVRLNKSRGRALGIISLPDHGAISVKKI